jgi:acylaminoacyl-peptidase
MFSAAVMRNPVISSGEISTSDIPDWYYSEFGFDYPVSTAPFSRLSDSGPIPLMPAETFSKLRAVSPIAHINNVTVPVLLLIGDCDRRVAPIQGIGYYHALKSHFGSEGAVQMLVFEGESHPLDGVEAGKVVFEAGRDWFKNCKSKFSNLGAGLA